MMFYPNSIRNYQGGDRMEKHESLEHPPICLRNRDDRQERVDPA